MARERRKTYMRKIEYIVVHCTASSQKWGVKDLEYEFYRRKGWKNPGYHYVVTADGKIHQMLAEAKVANGVRGYNQSSVHVAYVGGVDVDDGLKPVDNRTEAQKASLLKLVRLLRKKYPKAVVQGHRDFPNVRKDCPCFNARVEYYDA